MFTLKKQVATLALVCALMVTVLVGPASSALAAPDSAGIVLWYDGPFAFGFPDFESGLAAWLGIDIAAACSGGDPDISVIRFQDIIIPQADQRIVSVARSTALPVTVWRVNELDEFGCPIGTAAPIATGQVRLQLTDNDALAFLSDNQNVNAWGFTAHGTLTRSTGQPVQFSTVYRNVWDGVDTLKINHFVIRIQLS
jgi:hypothetical protein